MENVHTQVLSFKGLSARPRARKLRTGPHSAAQLHATFAITARTYHLQLPLLEIANRVHASFECYRSQRGRVHASHGDSEALLHATFAITASTYHLQLQFCEVGHRVHARIVCNGLSAALLPAEAPRSAHAVCLRKPPRGSFCLVHTSYIQFICVCTCPVRLTYSLWLSIAQKLHNSTAQHAQTAQQLRAGHQNAIIRHNKGVCMNNGR